MSTKRRIGVSAASTEAARRQLMQPVTCWEKVWDFPENRAPNSSLKVYKWVKTEKTQQFSDDEGGVDEPLAPLPDEVEVVEGDEENEQEEPNPDTVVIEETQPVEVNDATQDEAISKPPSPKPQLSMTMEDNVELVDPAGDVLDASLKPLDDGMNIGMDLDVKADEIELDMSALGPDGLSLESAHDLSQMEPTDALIGGQVMDQTVDPFVDQ